VYVLVQGNAEPPYRVNQHIDDFLERFEAYLRGLSLAEFGALKQGAVSHRKTIAGLIAEEQTQEHERVGGVLLE
jgi:secreted Zn-dependent insulinase-like peptidase